MARCHREDQPFVFAAAIVEQWGAVIVPRS
jgi:hypothetical protein